MNKIPEFWQALGSWQIAVLLSIPLLAWVVRVPVGGLLLRLLTLFLKGLGLEPGENLQKSLRPALQTITVVFGALIANEHMGLPEPYFTIIKSLLVSANVVAVFSVAYAMCVFIPQLVQRTRHLSIRQQSTLVLRVSRVVVVFLGIAAVMKVWGIDIGPALTGMGVAGAAVALAAQDTFKNLLGGLNNAAEQRFREGDLIRVDGKVEGIVESVDLRSTKIRRHDTAPVHVPNSDLANSAVINFGRRPNRRIRWTVALTYGTSNDVLRSIRDRVEAYIDESGLFAPAETTGRHVRVNALSDSSIDLLVYCFTKSTIYSEFLEAQEALALNILEIVKNEGGSFAFPSRSIYMESTEASDTSGESQC